MVANCLGKFRSGPAVRLNPPGSLCFVCWRYTSSRFGAAIVCSVPQVPIPVFGAASVCSVLQCASDGCSDHYVLCVGVISLLVLAQPLFAPFHKCLLQPVFAPFLPCAMAAPIIAGNHSKRRRRSSENTWVVAVADHLTNGIVLVALCSFGGVSVFAEPTAAEVKMIHELPAIKRTCNSHPSDVQFPVGVHVIKSYVLREELPMPKKIQHSPRVQYLDVDELQQIVSMHDGSLDPAWATSRILVFPSMSKTVKQHL